MPNDIKIVGDIAVDTEAMGLNNHRDRLCLVQISDEEQNIFLVQFEPNLYNAPNLIKLLTDVKRVKIMHFARFDAAILNKYLNIDIENIYCTKIASKIARTYTDMHGLKELCRELLGVSLAKQQQSSDWGASELTSEQIKYAASDVIYLHKIRKILNEMLVRENRLALAKKCFDFLPTRVALDLSGWNNKDIFEH